MRHLSRRAAVATALCGSLFATMSACGSHSSTSGGASGSKVLTYWQWRTEDTPGIQKVGQLFQKETGYKLQITNFGNDQTYGTKLEAASRARTLPDVVALNYGTAAGDNAATLAVSGLLVNLTKSFTPAWRQEIRPSALQNGLLTSQVIASTGTGATSLHGLKPNQIWALPYFSGSAGYVYVRKSTLKAIHASGPPKTYQQWISDMQASVKALGPAGGVSMGLAQQADWNFLFTVMSYSMLGNKDYVTRASAHPGSVSYSSPTSIKELSLFNELSPLFIPGSLSLDITPAFDAFIAKKSSWYIGGTFDMSGLVGGGIPAKDLVAFAIPGIAGGALPNYKLASIGLAQVAITTESKVPLSVTLKFLKLLTGPTGGQILGRYGYLIPAANLTNAQWATLPILSPLNDGLARTGGFDAYGSTQDPPTATSIAMSGGNILNEMIAGKLTPTQTGQKLAALYAAAWKSLGK
jgi:hypothetical protein